MSVAVSVSVLQPGQDLLRAALDGTLEADVAPGAPSGVDARSSLSSVTKAVAAQDAGSTLNAARLILARNFLKHSSVSITVDGQQQVVRTRRVPLSACDRKPSSLRREVTLSSTAPSLDQALLQQRQEESGTTLQGSTASTSPASDNNGRLTPALCCRDECESDCGCEQDLTPTSGVTSISTTSRCSGAVDSDDDFTLRPEEVLLDQIAVGRRRGAALPQDLSLATMTLGTNPRKRNPEGAEVAATQVPRRATPFEVPTFLSGVLTFCPIPGGVGGLADVAEAKQQASQDSKLEEEGEEDGEREGEEGDGVWVPAAHDGGDLLDIGSSVQTVESTSSSSVSPSMSLSEPRFESPAEAAAPPAAPSTPVANPFTRSVAAATKTTTPVPATPPKTSTGTGTAPASGGGRPSGLKNSRVRALAAETENLPSPKQPKSPAPTAGAPGTPVGPFGTAGAGDSFTAGALSPCDSPTLPSAVLGRSGPGAFTRRVFRSHSNQAMT